MPPTGVLYNLDQRQHVLIVIFGMQTRHGIGMFHQCTCRCYVQCMFNPFIQFTCTKALEVRALTTIFVNNLDIVPGLYEKGFGSLCVNTNILQRICQWVRQFKPFRHFDAGAFNKHHQRCGGVLCLKIHCLQCIGVGGRNNCNACSRGC